MSNPNDLNTIDKLRFILNCEIDVIPSTSDEISQSINETYGPYEGESVDAMLQEFTDTQIDFSETESYDLGPNGVAKDNAAIGSVVREAIGLGAKMILMLPTPLGCEVNFVIDDRVVARDTIEKHQAKLLSSRLKLLSHCSIAQRDCAMGTLQLTVGAEDYLAQMFFIPCQEGDCIVIVFDHVSAKTSQAPRAWLRQIAHAQTVAESPVISQVLHQIRTGWRQMKSTPMPLAWAELVRMLTDATSAVHEG